MLNYLVKKFVGTANDREIKALMPIVAKINSLEPQIKALSDEQLKAKTPEFRERLAKGESLDSILPEAFAVCREASWRVLGMRHFDVQLIGGMVLHHGKIAEMRTGEGKTLVATLPTYLNGLSGKGVHVVTVNDYLAKRDCEWMGRLYNWLGLTTGIIVHGLNDAQRKQNYGADITYGTNNEFGFDYLRDNMKFDLSQYVQREFNFAIVDEVDSILIDEARTPLIISGPAEASTDKYYTVNAIIPKLKPEVHFKIEEKTKSAALTDEGNHEVERLLGIENLYDPQHIELLHHVYQALKAHHLFKLDVDYMIKDGEVVIVDEFTGRLMPGRRWSDGLHQAIEAKEGVQVANENQTLATVTFQNYFRMYKKLAGMTGTADTEAAEFQKIYKLKVVVIPTNRNMIRNDMEDAVYKTERAKFEALMKDVKERHERGQPCLVGTASIEKSEVLSAILKRSGVKHTVLNAKHHEREAEIVAQAGRKGAVTIATNMAGRGTDILLGGNAEFLAKAKVADPVAQAEEYAQALNEFKKQCAAEREEVLALGGLHIVGTERHESRRIDNQLRGRAGRQGDPGSTRFYLSLEDNLMRIFNGERIQKIMTMLNVPEDEPIESGMVSRAIEGAQRKVEGHNFDIRKHLLEYDDVMNVQRETIYGLRRTVLEGTDLDAVLREMTEELADKIFDEYAGVKTKRDLWDLKGLAEALHGQFDIDISRGNGKSVESMNGQELLAYIKTRISEHYEDRKKALTEPIFFDVQKMLLLQSIDHRWKEHLLNMDHLKEGIGLRGYAQKDPLVEYKKEAFFMFQSMYFTIVSETIERLMKIQLATEEDQQREQIEEMKREEEEQQQRQRMTFTHGDAPAKPQTVVKNPGQEVGRNDPCPCGSGKKYKKCHGAQTA